jgi:hypothetical protein
MVVAPQLCNYENVPMEEPVAKDADTDELKGEVKARAMLAQQA